MGQTNATDPDVAVPDSLRPVGCCFSVFYDQTNPNISTVNFLLNTRDCQGSLGGGIHSSPTPIFTKNWISPNDECDGKMIYSSFSFLEKQVIECIAGTAGQDILGNIVFQDQINIDFDALETSSKTIMPSGGYSYGLYSRTASNNQPDMEPITSTVLLTLTAEWASSTASTQLVMQGSLFVSINSTSDQGLTYASWDKQWTYTISPQYTLENGSPALKIPKPTYSLLKDDLQINLDDAWKRGENLDTFIGTF